MSTNNIKIFDNFLTQRENNKIFDEMMSMQFSWGYSPAKVYDSKNHFRFTDLRNQQLVHMFYSRDGKMSSHIKMVNPIMKKLEALAVHRIKANLELYNGDTAFKSDFHVDWKNPYTKKGCKNMTIGIYYVNGNNGYTEFEDGTRIESVANLFVSFAVDLLHRGVSQTDTKERVVINFNYFCDS